MVDDEKLSRRDFFRKGIFSLIKEGSKLVQGTLEGFNLEVEEGVRYLRPPGAIAEHLFLKLCTRCGDCKEACPYDAIVLLGESKGKLAGTPVIIPTVTPCYYCEDFPCIKACKEGALTDSHLIMGKAVISTSKCYAYKQTFCIDCFNECPKQAIELDIEGRPKIIEEKCVGCGMCVRVCPATPKAIKVIPL